MSDWSERLAGEARGLLGLKGQGPLSRIELDRAAADLLSLQRGLTAGRELIGTAYMDEKRRLASYLLFYWPVSFAQTRSLLEMADRAALPLFPDRAEEPNGALHPIRILDLGSGPAPCALSAAEFFSTLRPGQAAPREVSITARDRSAQAIAAASRLAASGPYPFDGEGGWMAGDNPIPNGPFDLILLGHILNELRQGQPDRIEYRLAFLREAAARLAPGGILAILEPALLVTSRDLMEVRDRLAAEGFSILAPCLTDAPCPALPLEGQSCHSEFRWKLPETVRELSKRTGLDKELVKSAAFAFRKPHPAGDRRTADGPSGGEEFGARYRVVSEPMRNKAGRIRLLVCGQEGRFPLSIKPGEKMPAEKTFLGLRRSDAILLEKPLPRETGLAVGEGTEIRLL